MTGTVRPWCVSFRRVTAIAVVIVVLSALAAPAVALAQTKPEEPSRWGASFTFIPKWSIPTGDSALAALGELMATGADEGGANVEAKDFRIGVVRGKRLGGEWGVSFVKRSYKDGSTQGAVSQQCFQGSGPQPCFLFGSEYTYVSGVTLTGVEVNKFIAVATIKQLVQIGVDVAGGIGSMKGTATLREAGTDFVNGQTVQTDVTGPVEPSELYAFDPELIGRVEFVVGATLPQGLKARISLGINFPGTHSFSFTVLYLFGKSQ